MRRILIAFLGVAAAVLSFDSLFAHAMTSGLIPEHAIIPDWLLAGLWAITIDGLAVAGIWGIKANRGDKVAWSTFALASAASLWFQAATSQVAVLERSVAPVALGLAIVVLKIGSREQERTAATAAPTAATATTAEPAAVPTAATAVPTATDAVPTAVPAAPTAAPTATDAVPTAVPTAVPAAPTATAADPVAVPAAPTAIVTAPGAADNLAVVRQLLADDSSLTARRVMEATGVKERRAYQLLAEAKREGNGHRS